MPSRCDEMMISEQTEVDVRQCTVRDVARLAGVSVATVSRVVNGAGNVSGLTKERVLTAISTLQYCPNTSAIALGRAGGGISKKRGIYLPALALRKGKADFQFKKRRAE
jgi:DNA-binding LacI/PurR family transcriptional regulator